MRVPFVDWPAAYKLQEEALDAAWWRINNEGQLLLRKDVEDFENNLAKLCGSKYAVAVNSGTDALWMALQIAGIGPGDEVITVSHTFIATIQAIERCGAAPVFVDVGLDELMDVTQIRSKITPKTKAILPVHLTGKMCDMGEIQAIAREYNLKVIEDAAQAFGATRDGNKSGSAGDFGCFSFYPFKILGCAGDGGAVTTNDVDYARRLRLMRNHGNVSQTGMDVGEKGEVRQGWNSRLDNLQAAILNVRLEMIDEIWSTRKKYAEMYDKGLRGLPITLPTQQEGRVYQEYVIQAENRAEVTKFLNERGIDVLPNLKQQEFKLKPNHIMWSDEVFPMTDHFTHTNIRLPIWPTLAVEQIEYVITTIRKFYEDRN